jgi:hypothetical protein
LFWYDEIVRTDEQMARAAGRFARKWLPQVRQSAKLVKESGRLATESAKQWAPTARQSGMFLKHVVPAAIKPIHSLWHEIIGFIFLVFAGIAAYKIWQHPGGLPPVQLVIVVFFVVVMAGYGVSSIRKARRISRS